MNKLRLFHITDDQVERLPASLFRYEDELQDLLEQHLHDFLDVHFLKRKHRTDSGEIDALGIDDAGRPVIIEYKRDTDKNVVGQGLGYLGWLLRNPAEFKLLVIDKLDSERAGHIVWSPRLLIIASDFRDMQVDAAQTVRNIELLCYRRFGEQDFALEWVHGGAEEPAEPWDVSPTHAPIATPFATQDTLRQELREFLSDLGDDVTAQELKVAINFKRRNKRSFASEVLSKRNRLIVIVRLDPKSVTLEPSFTRDVSNIGHHGNGDLEITILNQSDLERAKPLLRDSYEANGETSRTVSASSVSRNSERYHHTSRLYSHPDVQESLRTDLRNYLRSLGNDVTVQERKHVINFMRRRSFASEIISIKSKLVVVARLEPGTVTLVSGFTRDISNVGHQGNGNLEITIHDRADLEKARPLLREAYERY